MSQKLEEQIRLLEGASIEQQAEFHEKSLDFEDKITVRAATGHPSGDTERLPPSQMQTEAVKIVTSKVKESGNRIAELEKALADSKKMNQTIQVLT